MRKIFYIFLILTGFISVSAQNAAKIKIQKSGLGKIAVVKGKVRSIIDLNGEVAGCVYLTTAMKRGLDKKGCAAPPADFKLINSIEKDKNVFLILNANAQENCNVCGRCGASEATTFIWLKLDAKLRLLEKKSLPIEFCDLNISMIQPLSDFNETTQVETWDLPFKDNIAVIEFERTIFGEEAKGEKDIFEFTHVEYDRTKPENGFVIKIEKRDKSSMPDQ